MTDRRTAYEWRTLLAERIKESGLRTAAFARDVLIREPRTVRRWLSADSPIPNRVKEWLQEPKVAPWPPPGLEVAREIVAKDIAKTIVRAATKEADHVGD